MSQRELELLRSINTVLSAINSIELKLSKFDEALDSICKNLDCFNKVSDEDSIEERKIALLNHIVQDSANIYTRIIKDHIRLDDESKKNIEIIRELLTETKSICERSMNNEEHPTC